MRHLSRPATQPSWDIQNSPAQSGTGASACQLSSRRLGYGLNHRRRILFEQPLHRVRHLRAVLRPVFDPVALERNLGRRRHRVVMAHHLYVAAIRGALFGVNDSLGNVAFIVAPLAATAVFSKNTHAVGILPAIGSIAALAIGWRLFRRPQLESKAA